MNRVPRNATVAVPLTYLNNFWRSLELINCKVELKLKWIKYGVLSAAGTDVDGNDDDNIIFTFKVTILYVPVVTLSARYNKKLSKLCSKRSVYCNEYKSKGENKNATNEFWYCLESNFVGVNRLFVLVYPNEDAASKRFKTKTYIPKGIIDNYNVIINGKNFYDQVIGSGIKKI